jgi:ankyrin repeat protein
MISEGFRTAQFFCLLCLVFSLGGCNSSPRVGGFVLAEVFDDPRVRELAQAGAKGQTSRMDRLLAEGVCVNAKGKFGLTPLWIAGSSQNLKGFTYLLSKGADPNVQTFRNSNVMLLAARSPDIRFLKAALAAGGDPDLVSEYDGRTPVFSAITARNEAHVRLLVEEYGVELDVIATLIGKGTPLLSTVAFAWWEMTYYLIENGADPFFGFSDGQSILDLIDRRPVPDEERKARWRERIRELMREKGYAVDD